LGDAAQRGPSADALSRRDGKAAGRTPGEVAVAWTLRLPAVTGATVGALLVLNVFAYRLFVSTVEVIVTYDEFGGSWDHVLPPPHQRQGSSTLTHDVFGPGTRVPSLLIAKKFRHSTVDHVDHDTTSILKLIEERSEAAENQEEIN
jgi:phospholipase C